jgi:phage shock protein E
MKALILALLFVPIVLIACQDAPASVRDISQEKFVASPPPGVLILDVRSQEEFAKGHVPNAVLIPHDELASRVTELGSDSGRPVVVYCESGKRAGMAGETLVEAGFTNVSHLEGDMRGWRESGHPTEQ